MPPHPPNRQTQRLSTPPSLPQKKSVACRPCHARKIKCSGNKPYNNCNRASECIYPARDHQVKVQQRYSLTYEQRCELCRLRLDYDPSTATVHRSPFTDKHR
ncbi:hypothetical protein DER46DRAFT_600453 [Fusarium sp. MPI-SDFR-AT-0072]|nr:hypothetical protein DER46DRAFT_600453 [Fusarium sp. MPI-SDFR-AT-0072]